MVNTQAGVWGFKNYPAPQVLQNRIMRFFLGVHRFAPLPAMKTEMDWLDMRRWRWLEMMRLYNRFCMMDQQRLPRKILTWDYKVGAKGWLRDILNLCNESGIPPPSELKYVYDLDPIQSKFLRKCREEWKDATEGMSKLDTYREVKDFADVAVLAKSNLPRNERSLVARLLCGILPLEVETGRFRDKKRQTRLCKICLEDKVEDELHFIFECKKLKDVRKAKLDTLLCEDRDTRRMTKAEKLKWLLSKEHIKEFGKVLACIYQARQDVMYSDN